MLEVRNATFGLHAPDAALAREWYERVLGRPPDLIPVDGVFEWRLAAGGVAAGGRGRTRAVPPVLRLGVPDLDAALRGVGRGRRARSARYERIPGVIALCDAEDPFGNVLSLYEELDG